jgi:uncharacterized membrane protein (UPF0127 family)
MRRRRILTGGAAALSLLLAGCVDGLSGGRSGEEGTGNTTPARADGTTDGGESGTGDETGEETDWPSGPYADYETTQVRVRTSGGEVLGEVRAAVAQTADQRYLGLSDADSLPEDSGMLFVFDAAADRTFVMREMDFGLDIVYADTEGVITTIHHAPAPAPDENGEQQRYPGYGQYVLEVGHRWSTERGVEEGDVLDFGL